MGLIKAAGTAVTGALADQWQEIIEASDMGETTVFTSGEKVNKGSNTKGRSDVISNGSVIRVYPNQFMMLVDGGKVIDYTAEEGYYTVEDSAMPSLFNGDFGETLKESFLRIKYGGETPRSQKVYFINLQEIKGLKFGTKNPVNYFDSFYNAELFLRTHGTYSIKITDPLRFYEEVVPRNVDQLDITSVNAQFLDEFLEALQSSINQMSADGVRISLVTSKARELGKYMAATLDEEWKQMRGIEIQSVGIASISYDEESTKLIHMRNQGAMLGDPSVREGYVQGAVARGLEAAGSNAAGSMAGFMGMGMGMNAGGGFMGAASNANMQQMQMAQNQAAMQQSQAAMAQSQAAVQQNQTAMQQNQAAAAPQNGQPGSWTCACGAVNTGNFCPNCGAKRPDNGPWTCSCGAVNTGKFCPNCGKPRP
ncbi:MAG TPA: SPFH domain-containing protein [Candidatus Lachnoclostridium stercoravium]|mgnify:FL=1|uniref:SPFH domain-containing protein n=1 Tax=Candidatus Lachnoclostridium stercoravium TaxID=2838633 RepID=A0A9D2KPB6_9FIRM|nr:SPFH domain-containing protein [Candidatus Lachnoclostridium stercoravium]